MDTLVNLEAFLATADAGGFSAAARKLNVATSVVAKRVTQLEERIGTALFHRSTRQLRLTEAGQQYVHRARGVVADVGDLLSRMGEKQRDLSDHLRVKAPTSLTVARSTTAMLNTAKIGKRTGPDSATPTRAAMIPIVGNQREGVGGERLTIPGRQHHLTKPDRHHHLHLMTFFSL